MPAWEQALVRNACLTPPAKLPTLVRSRPGSGPALAFSDAAALCCALAASEQKLGAALRLVDELRTQELVFNQQVALLSEAVAQARQFAHHDALTGLPNRRLLLQAHRFDSRVQCASAAAQNAAAGAV